MQTHCVRYNPSAMETHDQVLLALRRIMRAIDLRSRELMQKSGLIV